MNKIELQEVLTEYSKVYRQNRIESGKQDYNLDVTVQFATSDILNMYRHSSDPIGYIKLEIEELKGIIAARRVA